MFLTEAEVKLLTGKIRPAYQARELTRMGIAFIQPGSRGRSPVVLRSAIERFLPANKPAIEPELRIPK